HGDGAATRKHGRVHGRARPGLQRDLVLGVHLPACHFDASTLGSASGCRCSTGAISLARRIAGFSPCDSLDVCLPGMEACIRPGTEMAASLCGVWMLDEYHLRHQLACRSCCRRAHRLAWRATWALVFSPWQKAGRTQEDW